MTTVPSDIAIAQAAKMRPIQEVAAGARARPRRHPPVRTIQGQDQRRGGRARNAQGAARARHRDQSDAGRRGEEHRYGGPEPGLAAARQEGRRRHSRAAPRPRLRGEGRRGRRRLRAGGADGRDQPPLHRRFPRHHSAHNLLSAMLDNHLHQGNALNIDPRRITWPRTMDMNDRALRNDRHRPGRHQRGAGRARSGSSSCPAARSWRSSRSRATWPISRPRIGRIIVGLTRRPEAGHGGELKAAGAMTLLLKDAILPNLVQTLEGGPALVHAGPFGNIAHGCNSARRHQAGPRARRHRAHRGRLRRRPRRREVLRHQVPRSAGSSPRRRSSSRRCARSRCTAASRRTSSARRGRGARSSGVW